MSVWEYRDLRVRADVDIRGVKQCAFCECALTKFHKSEPPEPEARKSLASYVLQIVRLCPRCGWWTYVYEDVHPQANGRSCFTVSRNAYPTLRNLDLTDVSQPIEAVKQYLLLKFDQRFEMHPRLFEEVVASVFRDVGFHSEVTAYSNDGGIDVILRDSAEATIGVQVKRRKDRIAVDQIRELVGALVVGGHTRGIFVTTSSFQKGALVSAGTATARGYPIELIDASRFLDALRLSRRLPYRSFEEWRETIGDVPTYRVDADEFVYADC